MWSISDQFARDTVRHFGQADGDWIARLPTLIAACARRWRLTVQPPFMPLSYNYVAPATRADDTAVVLKIGFPHPELLTEIAALGVYAGRGAVRLLDADPEQGALLLERLWPGQSLATLADDDAATTIAAGVMRQIWGPPPPESAFPTVVEWTAELHGLREHFDDETGPFPIRLVEEAERLFTDLLAAQDAPVLLHGDLHHHNTSLPLNPAPGWRSIRKGSSASAPTRSAPSCATPGRAASGASPGEIDCWHGGSIASAWNWGSTARVCAAGNWRRQC